MAALFRGSLPQGITERRDSLGVSAAATLIRAAHLRGSCTSSTLQGPLQWLWAHGGRGSQVDGSSNGCVKRVEALLCSKGANLVGWAWVGGLGG